MNYNHLYYFYVVARSGSVTAAATELRVAQPSVSAQIKNLERSLGHSLFRRTGRGLRLSPKGEVAYGYCRRIFETTEALEREMEKAEVSGTSLHIGVSADIERPFLVEMIGQVTNVDRTRMRIKMSSDATERLSEQLRTDVMDAMISSEPVFEPEFSILASATMPVVLAYGHHGKYKRLAGASPSNLRMLSRELGMTWALPQKSMRLRKEIDAFFERHKLKPDVVFESDVMATVVRAVADGVGVALLPKPYLSSYPGSERFRWTGPGAGYWGHGIWLIGRRQRRETKELQLLRTAFRRTLGERRTNQK